MLFNSDRMYNLLKGKYRSQNIWTTEQLDNNFRSCGLVTVVQMTNGRFKDFETFMWNHYTEPNHVTSYHLFEFGFSEKATEYLCKIFRDSDEWITHELKPGPRTHRSSRKLSGLERQAAVDAMNASLNVETPPGLPDVKECEMYFSWRPLFPDDEAMKNATCPKPSDEVCDGHRSRNRAKQRLKVAEKKVNKKKAGAGMASMLLFDPQIDIDVDGSVDENMFHDEMFGFDIDTGDLDNDMFGFELGSHVMEDDERNK